MHEGSPLAIFRQEKAAPAAARLHKQSCIAHVFEINKT
jgi:hypothetical protein